jgi:hypothetical protein
MPKSALGDVVLTRSTTSREIRRNRRGPRRAVLVGRSRRTGRSGVRESRLVQRNLLISFMVAAACSFRDGGPAADAAAAMSPDAGDPIGPGFCPDRIVRRSLDLAGMAPIGRYWLGSTASYEVVVVDFEGGSGVFAVGRADGSIELLAMWTGEAIRAVDSDASGVTIVHSSGGDRVTRTRWREGAAPSDSSASGIDLSTWSVLFRVEGPHEEDVVFHVTSDAAAGGQVVVDQWRWPLDGAPQLRRLDAPDLVGVRGLFNDPDGAELAGGAKAMVFALSSAERDNEQAVIWLDEGAATIVEVDRFRANLISPQNAAVPLGTDAIAIITQTAPIEVLRAVPGDVRPWVTLPDHFGHRGGGGGSLGAFVPSNLDLPLRSVSSTLVPFYLAHVSPIAPTMNGAMHPALTTELAGENPLIAETPSGGIVVALTPAIRRDRIDLYYFCVPEALE